MLVLITWPASVTGAGGGATRLGRGSLVLMDPCIELRTFLILMFPSLYYAHFGWTRFCSFSPNRSSKNKFSQNSMTQCLLRQKRHWHWIFELCEWRLQQPSFCSAVSGADDLTTDYTVHASLYTNTDTGHGNASVHRVWCGTHPPSQIIQAVRCHLIPLL